MMKSSWNNHTAPNMASTRRERRAVVSSSTLFSDGREEDPTKTLLSPSEILERAYLVSCTGGILDEDEEMMTFPDSIQIEARLPQHVGMETLPQLPLSRQQQENLSSQHLTTRPIRDLDESMDGGDGDFFHGIFDHDDQDTTPFASSTHDDRDEDDGECSNDMDCDCNVYDPIPCPSDSVSSSTNKACSNNDLFVESLRILNNVNAETHRFAVRQRPNMTWTVQDAVDAVESSNRHSDSRVVLLTLTSFPFRIAHASNAFMKRTGRGCDTLGRPLADYIGCDHNSPMRSQQQLMVPSVPSQFVLEHHEESCSIDYQIDLFPVVDTSRAMLVYYAIVLKAI